MRILCEIAAATTSCPPSHLASEHKRPGSCYHRLAFPLACLHSNLQARADGFPLVVESPVFVPTGRSSKEVVYTTFGLLDQSQSQ